MLDMMQLSSRETSWGRGKPAAVPCCAASLIAAARRSLACWRFRISSYMMWGCTAAPVVLHTQKGTLTAPWLRVHKTGPCLA